MRFKIEVDLQGVSLKLPLNYQEVIQGILYHALPEEVANDAHRQEKGVRKMPLFTFSSLHGTYAINREQGAIYFDSLYFFVSCLDDSLGFSLVTNLFKGITIFGHQFPCQITSLPDYGGGNWIELLSPVTVRKTNLDTKKTTYFEPNTMEFTSAIYQSPHFFSFSSIKNTTKKRILILAFASAQDILLKQNNMMHLQCKGTYLFIKNTRSTNCSS